MLDRGWNDYPRPMTGDESLALLRAAAAPWHRLMSKRKPSTTKLQRAWDWHAAVARRLGYCYQPGCETETDQRFCQQHQPQWMSIHPIDQRE